MVPAPLAKAAADAEAAAALAKKAAEEADAAVERATSGK
jgi:hypothetical protein